MGAIRAPSDSGGAVSTFNEDSRVKIPALLHLSKLGYRYLSLKDAARDRRNNVFSTIFTASVARINPGADAVDAQRLLDEIQLDLQHDDLGRAFHKRLIARAGLRLIDFDNLDNNDFHVVTELPFENGEDCFRPDITLLVNGLPLAIIEVKKRMNPGGVLEERRRMDRRHANPKFRHFFNLIQLQAFSNNMEYDDGAAEPIQGAFYAASTYGEAHFNYFREERWHSLAAAGPAPENLEDAILTDTSLASIKGTPEFERNKAADTPTHRLLTSLFSRQRFAFLLQYAFAWLDEEDGIQKHVMRYPQLFATLAIADRLASGVRKGIVWHTQGSGKTALAYYNVRFLTDWFQQRGQVPRFYFIVDRLDLLDQASREFRKRGLAVNVIDSRDAFARDIKKAIAVDNDRGQPEITVVNIQKFRDDPDVAAAQDYSLAVQRVYFLDEVHRSYNPRGSFLANLEQSDRNAIKIGLTGTPLIGEQLRSRALFGDYIHTYYYNASIADGYTLRLIREEIATRYRMQLQQALADIEVQQGGIDRKALYAHPRFASAMLDYILDDFARSRVSAGDDSFGGMVICDSAEQARELHRQFQRRMKSGGDAFPLAQPANDAEYRHNRAADASLPYGKPRISAALILHDEGDKAARKAAVEQFKKGGIDLLFVYNMLLTGFDAPRLKKLYLARVIKDHNLLQALTRVNRRYRTFRYGYVVDFADIQAEFDKANRNYYDELSAELGDEVEHYSQLFRTQEEIRADLIAIQEALFEYALDDAELFSQQVGHVTDIDQLRAIVRALTTARELHNLIRLGGHDQLAGLMDFHKLRQLHTEAKNALAALSLKHQIEQAHDTSGLLNQALEEVIFKFEKIGEAELKLADELKDILRRTRETLADTSDPQDPAWISLREELERLFKARKLSEVSQPEMEANIVALRAIEQQARQLNHANANLAARYGGDRKLMRVHKRLLESRRVGGNQTRLHAALNAVKQATDRAVLGNGQLLGTPEYFEKHLMPIVVSAFRAEPPVPDVDTFRFVHRLLAREYLGESQGRMSLQ